jgi:hypothetical protein
VLGAVNAFIRKQAGQDPSKVAAGYSLKGQPIDQYAAMAFIAPMGVSAMVGAENQSWLNSLWDRIVATDVASDEYFGNNIKMLALIAMSGNYWAP